MLKSSILLVIFVIVFLISGCGSDNNSITSPTPTPLEVQTVSIQGGSFQMGQIGVAEPIHSVSVSSFNMAKYEVTNSEFCAFLNSQGDQVEGGVFWADIQPESNPHCGLKCSSSCGTFSVKSGYEKRPVAYVSWYGAVAYCNWLSGQSGLTSCYGPKDNRGNPSEWRTKNGYRLPTEAEWEYACRGGKTTGFYWGDTVNDDYLWHIDNSGGNHHDVGQKLPNSFGLYDMSGNVWEWCSDWYGIYGSSGQTDPVGPSNGSLRISRSGSWISGSSGCQSAVRGYVPPDDRTNRIGFRVVRN